MALARLIEQLMALLASMSDWFLHRSPLAIQIISEISLFIVGIVWVAVTWFVRLTYFLPVAPLYRFLSGGREPDWSGLTALFYIVWTILYFVVLRWLLVSLPTLFEHIGLPNVSRRRASGRMRTINLARRRASLTGDIHPNSFMNAEQPKAPSDPDADARIKAAVERLKNMQ